VRGDAETSRRGGLAQGNPNCLVSGTLDKTIYSSCFQESALRGKKANPRNWPEFSSFGTFLGSYTEFWALSF
jgi:hypothetical protein